MANEVYDVDRTARFFAGREPAFPDTGREPRKKAKDVAVTDPKAELDFIDLPAAPRPAARLAAVRIRRVRGSDSDDA